MLKFLGKLKPSIVSPFFQWVEGKRNIVDQLVKYIPPDVNNYYESFLSGEALFVQVKNKFQQYFYLVLI